MPRRLLPTILLLFLCLHHNTGDTQDLTNHPGHLKPFGKSGQVVQVPSVHEYPDSNQFLEDFVLGSKPLLIKNVAKQSPAFHLWTDAYLRKVADDTKLRVDVGKKEKMNVHSLKLSMNEILDKYNSSDYYFFDNVPRYLWPDVTLPCPLQRPGLRHAFIDILIWMSSGGTNSILHIDQFDNILCVFRGTKTALLLEKYKKHMFTLKKRGYVEMDVDKVDLTQIPYLAGATFYKAEMEAGDCLFIPFMWPHQIRSFGSNIAVNFWWSHAITEQLHEQGLKKDGDLVCDPEFTLKRLFDPSDEDPHAPTDRDEL